MLWTGFLAIFVTYICFQNLTPLYPTVARDLGVDAGSLGALVGIASVVSLLLQVPLGVAGDRIGRRPFMVLGLLAASACQVLRWRAGSGWEFGLAQAFAGIATGGVTLAALAAVADAYPSGRGQALGVLGAALNLGQVAGYFLSGLAGPQLGWRTLSLLIAVLPLLALGVVAMAPERRPPPRPVPVRRDLALAVRHLGRPGVAGLGLAAALVLALGQGGVYLLPFALAGRGAGARETAVLLLPYIAGSVLGGPLSGRLADRVGSRRLVAALIVLGGVAIALYPLLASSRLLTAVLFVLVGVSVNGVLAILGALVVERGDSTAVGTGTRLAGLRVGQALGPALGPVIAGLGLTHGGLGLGAAGLAGGMAVALALFLSA